MVWEFEPGFAFNKPSDILRVIDGVNHDNFYTMFDTCHADNVAVHGQRQPGKKETLPGGIRELAQLLKGKIGRLHLIDSDGTINEHMTSTHPPFGEGAAAFRRVHARDRGCRLSRRLVDHRPVLLAQRLGRHRQVQGGAGQADPEVRLAHADHVRAASRAGHSRPRSDVSHSTSYTPATQP